MAYHETIVEPVVQGSMLVPEDMLFSIDLLPDGTGWAVGEFGLLLHSADGGKHWQKWPAATGEMLTSIGFADSQHGFVVGRAGTVIATTDGGRTWQKQKTPTRQQLLAVSVIDDKRAWAVGSFGTVIFTNDGGATWHREKLDWSKLIPNVIKTVGEVQPNLNDVYFYNSQVGWIVGEFGLVLRTDDGGATWSTMRYGADLPQLYSVSIRHGQNGWAVGQHGTLLQTTDGGTTWKKEDLGNSDFYAIAQQNSVTALVGDGTMYVKRGSSEWTKSQFPSDLWLSGVSIHHGSVVAVGEAGTIYTVDLNNRTSSAGQRN